MNLLNSQGFNLIQNPIEKEMDLIINEGIEVKMDEYAQYSGNFYIEFECNGKPSGLFREEKIHLKRWAHTDGKILYLVDGEHLKKYVIEYIEKCRNNKTLTHKQWRVVENGGNGGRSKGLLVPSNEMEKQADLIYNFKEND